MSAPEGLEAAFAAWEQARNTLTELRKQLPARTPGQQAEAPELAKMREQIRVQEDVCKPLFEELTKIAEQAANVRLDAELAARVARVIEKRNLSGT